MRIERTGGGDRVVMTPAGWESSRRNARIVAALAAWAEGDGSGVVTDSSGGFLLPNGAMRSPDAAWLSRRRRGEVPAAERERFLPLVPEFMVELLSPSDARAELEAKTEEWIANGVRLGWLIDPFERRVAVYRPEREPEVLEGVEAVAGDPELPGFVLELDGVWVAG